MAPTKLAKQTRKVAPQNAAAAHQLALWYFTGEEGLSKDLDLASKWEREAANRGCADAQFTLGDFHASRCFAGLQADLATSFAWFQKAALQGRAIHDKPPLCFRLTEASRETYIVVIYRSTYGGTTAKQFE